MDPFMARAFEEAQKGVDLGDGGPFGAVVVKDGVVIAQAHNEVVKLNDPTAHAEILAIRKAAAHLKHFHLHGCLLYTTGEPCPMCFSAIYWAHLERVVYCMPKDAAAKIGFDDTLITDILIHQKQATIPFVYQPHVKCDILYKRWYASSSVNY